MASPQYEVDGGLASWGVTAPQKLVYTVGFPLEVCRSIVFRLGNGKWRVMPEVGAVVPWGNTCRDEECSLDGVVRCFHVESEERGCVREVLPVRLWHLPPSWGDGVPPCGGGNEL